MSMILDLPSMMSRHSNTFRKLSFLTQHFHSFFSQFHHRLIIATSRRFRLAAHKTHYFLLSFTLRSSGVILESILVESLYGVDAESFLAIPTSNSDECLIQKCTNVVREFPINNNIEPSPSIESRYYLLSMA